MSPCSIPIVIFEADPYVERAKLCETLALLGYPVRVVEKETRYGYQTKYFVYVYPKVAISNGQRHDLIDDLLLQGG